jgi:hypothetical protein
MINQCWVGTHLRGTKQQSQTVIVDLVDFYSNDLISDIQSDTQEDCQYWGMYGHDTLYDSLDNNDDVCYLCDYGGDLVCCEVGATCSNLIIP